MLLTKLTQNDKFRKKVKRDLTSCVAYTSAPSLWLIMVKPSDYCVPTGRTPVLEEAGEVGVPGIEDLWLPGHSSFDDLPGCLTRWICSHVGVPPVNTHRTNQIANGFLVQITPIHEFSVDYMSRAYLLPNNGKGISYVGLITYFVGQV